jgi:hypothetical protein
MRHAMGVLVVITLATVSGLSSCATARSEVPVEEFPVAGLVTSGPTCPVQQDPPDPTCADRPVPGATMLIRDSRDDVYSEVTTDADGRFRVELPAGDYVIEPQPVVGLLGTAQAIGFAVGPGPAVELTIQYDTGIR